MDVQFMLALIRVSIVSKVKFKQLLIISEKLTPLLISLLLDIDFNNEISPALKVDVNTLKGLKFQKYLIKRRYNLFLNSL